MATQVFLHVGPPKTGTSYLQGILWANREALKDVGLLLPGTRRGQVHAVVDVRGNAERTHFPPRRVEGAWTALVAEMRAWPGRALVSRETLCAADSRQIERIVCDLAPADVHVVLTVRDLARAIPAYWQQGVRVGRSDSLESYVQGIVDGAGWTDRFQRSQLPERVAARWAEHVPADRVHIVTLPPPGSAPETLWRRFSAVLDLDRLPLVEAEPVNPSLGVVETELLRRTNARLTPRLRERQRAYWTKTVLANNILGRRPSEAFSLPPQSDDWVRRRADQSVQELRAGGYDVHGDLADLVPVEAGPRRRQPGEVGDDELLAAATDTIAELVLQLRDTTFALRRARARARRRGVPAPARAPERARWRRLVRGLRPRRR